MVVKDVSDIEFPFKTYIFESPGSACQRVGTIATALSLSAETCVTQIRGLLHTFMEHDYYACKKAAQA